MWRPIFELTISVITKTEGDCLRSPSQQQQQQHQHCPHCHLLILNEVFVIDRNTLSTFSSRPVETSVQRAELGFLKSPQFILILVDNTTSLNPSLNTNTRHTATCQSSLFICCIWIHPMWPCLDFILCVQKAEWWGLKAFQPAHVTWSVVFFFKTNKNLHIPIGILVLQTKSWKRIHNNTFLVVVVNTFKNV